VRMRKGKRSRAERSAVYTCFLPLTHPAHHIPRPRPPLRVVRSIRSPNTPRTRIPPRPRPLQPGQHHAPRQGARGPARRDGHGRRAD
jgi:hypothetical protein